VAGDVEADAEVADREGDRGEAEPPRTPRQCCAPATLRAPRPAEALQRGNRAVRA
jgi:hypothetical protein